MVFQRLCLHKDVVAVAVAVAAAVAAAGRDTAADGWIESDGGGVDDEDFEHCDTIAAAAAWYHN